MKTPKIPSENISTLDWSNCGLKKIPKEVFQLKNLRKLKLSNNNITEIPVEIADLKLLEVLDLSNNKISNVYTKFCDLKGLRILILRNNKIEFLPKQIEKLQKLRKLDLSGNKIKSLPNELANLKNLVSINLSNNLLTHLPNSIFALSNMQHLWIADLPLHKFSTSLITESYKSLKTIHAFSNKPHTLDIDIDYLELSKVSGNSKKKLFEINNYNLIKGIENRSKEKVVIGNNHKKKNEIQKHSKKKIFISYSRKDVGFKDELKKHLNILRTFSISDNWSCEEIKIGRWESQIERELRGSDLIIYMLSGNFFDSRYILEKEVINGLEQVESDKEKNILCVIVSDFIGLDKLKNATSHLNDTNVNSLLKLSEFQYLPYDKLKNTLTGNFEERIVSLKEHSNKNTLEKALTQITEKVLEYLK